MQSIAIAMAASYQHQHNVTHIGSLAVIYTYTWKLWQDIFQETCYGIANIPSQPVCERVETLPWPSLKVKGEGGIKKNKAKIKSSYYVIGSRPQALAEKKGLRPSTTWVVILLGPITTPLFVFIANRLKCKRHNLWSFTCWHKSFQASNVFLLR